MKTITLLSGCLLLTMCGCGSPANSTGTTPNGNVGTAALSAEDQQAVSLLKDVYALIEQKNAAEAEAKLTELIALKPKLSAKIRAQVAPAIAGLGMVEPDRALKLAPLWDKS